ncbi:MAG: multicopper oxidase domain-containing protein, partial [Bryobacterales bacterium]|nr:multicopper oxidase domain-containing protein [Bryobacterales bacterium]
HQPSVEVDDDRWFHLIATDGGFLEAPLRTDRVTLAPGERAEILVDFSDGAEALLKSHPEAGLLPTLESLLGGIGTGNLELLKIVPGPASHASHALPAHLNTIPRIDASSAAKVRPMVLAGPPQAGRGRGGRRPGPPINGKIMDMARIDEVVRLGDIEIWEISNRGAQSHPFHVHLVQFQVVDRNGRPPSGAELGWKDTILVPPGDLVRVIMRFERYADTEVPYMYHCHIMEHEDNGMMGQFLVVEDTVELSGRANSSAK